MSGGIRSRDARARQKALDAGAFVTAQRRLLVVGLAFALAFTGVGAAMGMRAGSAPAEPPATGATTPILSARADITDRHGRVLATNIDTHALYAHPQEMVDPAGAAERLGALFPELDVDRLTRRLSGERTFVWIRANLSPEQMQAVHDIGEPGLYFGPREMRLYPNGRAASHVLGGFSFGNQGTTQAEVIGTAGVERHFDARLRDPARVAEPLALSLDLSVQAAVEEVLASGMTLMNARGASAVLMDARTGEIVSLVSLPDFDPNDRPRRAVTEDPADSPVFNRAVQGVYELGSVFKIFPVAQAMEQGRLGPQTRIDTTPLRVSGFRIRDFRDYGPTLSATDVIVKSSNRGTARIALGMGAQAQRDFLSTLGFFEATPLELSEAPTGVPLIPDRWSDIVVTTASYGHGFSSSPVHLAAGYASVLNGGTRVQPTLLRQDGPVAGPRVVSEATSARAREMLRQVVVRGTARLGEVPGYEVGGKTGTADKPRPNGGYFEDRVIATFASVFPASDPRYVLIVTLDEPTDTTGEEPRRTAGWTAVPVAAEIVRRTAPLMGLPPVGEAVPTADALTPGSRGGD
ncbi:MAG: peptidoglycan D,D-transpeptidase FtsI family protein [Paracoccaceae bacterium]